MPFRGTSVSARRLDFVEQAHAVGANKRALRRAFVISPTMAYEWLKRAAERETAFGDRSRRPHRSPGATETGMEPQVLAVRRAHPAWGGRKIRHVLRRRGLAEVPHANTITGILRRTRRSASCPGLRANASPNRAPSRRYCRRSSTPKTCR